ncbi:hypothetical protein HMPREF1556_00573 [Porphyromonas sp. oral taxon 278 str. W7784]|nr:hypothetical protein HMPREF1556_00573 [Porphyromonas sp. oral taxon 278 str. W7784]
MGRTHLLEERSTAIDEMNRSFCIEGVRTQLARHFTSTRIKRHVLM